MAHPGNVLILSSNTGGGHSSAALALEDAFGRLRPELLPILLLQAVEELSPLTHKLVDTYNYLLRHHQHAMKYYFWAVNRLKPYESRLLFQLGLKYGKQLFEKFSPSVLVSVHPMTQHFFAFLLRRLGLQDRIPLITVVTDPCYGFWKGWACDDVQRYYVASEDARRQLLDFEVPDDKIEVSGMPIHRRFQPLADDLRPGLKNELGLDPERFTVLLNAGWSGGGNIPAYFEALKQQAPPNAQFVYLCGKNAELYEQAQRMAAEFTSPIHVVGYTPDLAPWMQAADLMISKLGGLTTFEALACQLPILADGLTAPMPQEAKTGELIIKAGAGQLVTSTGMAMDRIHELAHNPAERLAMRRAAATLGRVGAADFIAQDILARHG